MPEPTQRPFPSPLRGAAASVWTPLFALFLAAGAARAQTPGGRAGSDVFVGSEMESYLRTLQVAGKVPLYPWTVRSFSPVEVNRLLPAGADHPWADRYGFRPDTAAGPHAALLAPRGSIYLNSGFPHGAGDGVVWEGRGLTAAVQFGFNARYGPLSLRVAPIAFWSQNASFPLSPSSSDATGRERFRDPRSGGIDLPQRFGDGSYARLDPGESTLRLDLGPVTVGASTASQWWGPAREFPLILGNNAGGFPHAFLGTGQPLDLWVGHLYGRVVWGRLDQSDYSRKRGEGRRFMSGLVVAFTPRGIPGLELGAERFFHNEWPANGLGMADLRRPIEALFKRTLALGSGPEPDSLAENQLAGVYARWTLPASGFEAYFEFMREDHAWDLRHFLLTPEDLSGYTIGFTKTWEPDADHLTALRVEVLDTQNGRRGRRQDGGGRIFVPYTHSDLFQGHTLRGQLLSSPAGYGGAGSVVGLDRYHPGGRWTIEWKRSQRGSRPRDPDQPDGDAKDVMHSLGVEGLFFRGRYDLTVGVQGVYELNRYYQADAFNLRVVLGVRVAP